MIYISVMCNNSRKKIDKKSSQSCSLKCQIDCLLCFEEVRIKKRSVIQVSLQVLRRYYFKILLNGNTKLLLIAITKGISSRHFH